MVEWKSITCGTSSKYLLLATGDPLLFPEHAHTFPLAKGIKYTLTLWAVVHNNPHISAVLICAREVCGNCSIHHMKKPQITSCEREDSRASSSSISIKCVFCVAAGAVRSALRNHHWVMFEILQLQLLQLWKWGVYWTTALLYILIL